MGNIITRRKCLLCGEILVVLFICGDVWCYFNSIFVMFVILIVMLYCYVPNN